MYPFRVNHPKNKIAVRSKLRCQIPTRGFADSNYCRVAAETFRVRLGKTPWNLIRQIVVFSLGIGFVSIHVSHLSGQTQSAGQAATAWERIESYFAPPVRWQGQLGSYRSPLLFEDGHRATKKEDWLERRHEILDRWDSMMGSWPELIAQPKVEILESKRRENLTQQRVRFDWTPDQQTTGYLLLPEGDDQRAAVLCVYYEPETGIGMGTEYRDFAIQLARRGFVTLSIGTTEATKAGTYSLYHPSIEDARVEPLSMLAYAAANAWHVLAQHPRVDAERIGIVGHSFGGKWAMFASCLFDKFACAAWSDPGIVFDEVRPNINYWEPWYLGYHPPPWRPRGVITEQNPPRGLYKRLRNTPHDLHELHALMAPRPFLVSGGAEDPPQRWEALNHSIQVNRLLGVKNRVAMTNRVEHAPNAESNAVIYDFFEHFLDQSSQLSNP